MRSWIIIGCGATDGIMEVNGTYKEAKAIFDKNKQPGDHLFPVMDESTARELLQEIPDHHQRIAFLTAEMIGPDRLEALVWYLRNKIEA